MLLYAKKTKKQNFLLDVHIIFQNHFCHEELQVFSPELFWGLPKVLPCAYSNSSHRSFTSETIERTSHLALQYLSKAWKALFLQQDCLPPPVSTNHSSSCHHNRHWCPYNHNSAATSAMEVLEIPHSDSMSPPSTTLQEKSFQTWQLKILQKKRSPPHFHSSLGFF